MVRDADVVIELVGGEVFNRSYQVLKPGGFIASLTQLVSQEKLDEFGIRGEFVFSPDDGKILAQMATQMEAGVIKTHIFNVFPLSQTLDAIALGEEGHTRGKIVSQVR
ncbi:MAG: NADPH:quinone reductase-like Zn-dependent oxidoreductase [Candidatus Krumholzibacteriia bacterium]